MTGAPDPKLPASSKPGWRRPAFLALLLFVMALLARTAAFGRYVTPDEYIWLYWGLRVRAGVLVGDWAATIQSGQPGITTTWLGALAGQLMLWLRPEAARAAIDYAGQLAWLTSEYGEPYQRLAMLLPAARWLSAVITATAVAAIYRLAERRWGGLAALIGGVALALDPFSAGLSGLLISDAFLAYTCLLTLLLVVPVRNRLPSGRMAALAGITTALAVLSKLPGLLLIVLVPLIWLWHAGRRRAWRSPTVQLAAWGVALVVTLLVLLPAIWGAPAHLIEMLRSSAGLELSITQTINFFGRPWDNPSGFLYYPVAIALRLSMLATMGLLFVRPPAFRQLGPFVAWSSLFSVLFIVGLSLSTRVFDRYALPVSLLLTLLGGVAFGYKIDTLTGTRKLIGAASGTLVAALFLLASWPTPLFAYNWLLGGQTAARWALPVGWGEPYSAAARALADDPTFDGAIYTDNVPAVAPFVNAELFFLREQTASHITLADAVILTMPSATPVPTSDKIAWNAIPLHMAPARQITTGNKTVGIYRNIDPARLDVRFVPLLAQNLHSGGLRLVAAGAGQLAPGYGVYLRMHWVADDARGPITAGYAVIDIEDDRRHRWASLELPLVDRSGLPAAVWQPGSDHLIGITIPLLPDIPPGRYRVVATLFDADGARLGQFTADGNFAGVRSTLADITLSQDTNQSAVPIPHPLDAGALAGHAELPDRIDSRAVLTLDVWWRRGSETTAPLSLMLRPADGSTQTMSATVDVADVPVGNLVHLRPSWPLPDNLAAGTAELLLNGTKLGAIEIVVLDRTFALPADVTAPLGVQFAPLGRLQAADVTRTDGQLTLRLVWQADEAVNIDYTTFVHVRDAGGVTVTQQDRQPPVATSRWVTDQVIVDMFTFATDVAFDAIAVGMYDPNDGTRLPVYDSDGTPLGDQYVVQLAP